MDLVLSLVAGVAGVVLGVWAGWRLVKRFGSSRGRFWALNGVLFVVCVALCALGGALGATWAVVGSLALLFGSLTGIKYGWHGGLPSGEARDTVA